MLYDSNKCHVERFLHYRHDLENILSYLDVGPNFRLMGFSLGGLISMEFCFNTTYRYKPRAVALIAPFLGINMPFSPRVVYPILKILCNIRSFALAYTPHGKEYKRVPDFLEPYLRRYSGEKVFHVTSDRQVFLDKNHHLARLHQESLGKGKLKTYNI